MQIYWFEPNWLYKDHYANSVIKHVENQFWKNARGGCTTLVCSTEKNVSKYYLDVAQDNPNSEITKTKFEQLKKIINRAGMLQSLFV